MPASFVLVLNSTPVSGLTTLTAAPAIAAPDGSVIVPLNVPSSPCAKSTKATGSDKSNAHLSCIENPSTPLSVDMAPEFWLSISQGKYHRWSRGPEKWDFIQFQSRAEHPARSCPIVRTRYSGLDVML